ncbi:MAG TPA: hypothetical protein VM571_07055 [Noviherbaspirillum sp.]|nr:hypothetical protein [Noviherbaspirillum sp.]
MERGISTKRKTPMIHTVFDKTDKGREEIATRKYRLAPRLRTLLVLIDGKQTGGDLLQKVSGIGLNEESLAELLQHGFIRSISIPAPDLAAQPTATMAVAVPAATESVLAEGQSQYLAIYKFYTATIKSTIGLRGYGLQLKVEKAASVADFRALRQPYLEAVHKAKGPEMERSLRSRLDQLLYLEEPAPSTTSINLHAAAE